MKTKGLLVLTSQAMLTNMARRRFRRLPKTRPMWLRMIPKIAPLLLRRELDIGTCGFSLKKEAVQWSISRFWGALSLYFDKPFQSQARTSKTLCTQREPLPCLSKRSRHTLILTSAHRDLPLTLQHIRAVVRSQIISTDLTWSTILRKISSLCTGICMVDCERHFVKDN